MARCIVRQLLFCTFVYTCHTQVTIIKDYLLTYLLIIELLYEISNNVECANNKASYHPASTNSLIENYLNISLKLLIEYHLGFLALEKALQARLSLVQMLHCWKSHVTAPSLC